MYYELKSRYTAGTKMTSDEIAATGKTQAKGVGYISPSGEQRERNTICTEAKCCSRSMVTSIPTPQKSGRLGRARNTYRQTTAQATQQTTTQPTTTDILINTQHCHTQQYNKQQQML